jgi:putative proteasome-type protease
MTYCVGLCLRDGLVMLSDTRTNAGVDHISTFSKMNLLERPGERVICVMSAGNLAITQQAWGHLQAGVLLDGQRLRLDDVNDMFQAARLLGAAVRVVHAQDAPALSAQGIGFDASFLLGGQIGAEAPRLFLVYAAGNFIEATPDTPFLQIGEVKYGKPILDRVLTHDTPVEDAVKLALVSMDSTLRSNLTVGMPLDLMVARAGALQVTLRRRLGEDDPYVALIRHGWSEALRQAYMTLPRPDWA